MEKILVTTDLSANSASAIRFAHKLCLIRGAVMVVLYVDELPVPTGWSLAEIDLYQQKKELMSKTKVHSFVNRICSSLRKPIVETQIEIKRSANVVNSIKESCIEHGCRYVCISTHGAGKIKRIIGTHTSKLIASSPIPVICIPKGYRIKKINTVCYASDMVNYKKEFKRVLDFAAPLGARLALLHLCGMSMIFAPGNELSKELRAIAREEVSLHLFARDFAQTLHRDLDQAIKRIAPSLVVFFSQQQHAFMDQLFHTSIAQSQSFITKIPILSFRK